MLSTAGLVGESGCSHGPVHPPMGARKHPCAHPWMLASACAHMHPPVGAHSRLRTHAPHRGCSQVPVHPPVGAHTPLCTHPWVLTGTHARTHGCSHTPMHPNTHLPIDPRVPPPCHPTWADPRVPQHPDPPLPALPHSRVSPERAAPAPRHLQPRSGGAEGHRVGDGATAARGHHPPLTPIPACLLTPRVSPIPPGCPQSPRVPKSPRGP